MTPHVGRVEPSRKEAFWFGFPGVGENGLRRTAFTLEIHVITTMKPSTLGSNNKEKIMEWHQDPRLAHIPFHMRGDEWQKIQNEEAGHALCDRCGGTGNELLSMYRKCPDCGGTGIVKTVEK